MRWIKRTDLFEVGDRVEVIDEDPYDGYFMGERMRKAHGPGPYVVEAIETHAAWMIDKYPHPQDSRNLRRPPLQRRVVQASAGGE